MNENYFKPSEVAKVLRVSTRLVQIWVQERKLRAVRIGKLIRIPQSAVEEMVADIESASAPVVNIRGAR